MKFGDTLYHRSVPKWAAYNVNYNEIKQLIKRRTTQGIAEPVPIPGSSTNRWRELEDELFTVVKSQHDNIHLFLRSKYGEIERRLAHLEKQLKGAQRVIETANTTPTVQVRRYHRLVKEADQVGEDVQCLSRFSSVQKTAFRKILKKYRKWTHSFELQNRLEREVFAGGHLNIDYATPLERLTNVTKIITEELQKPMLHGEYTAKQREIRQGSVSLTSNSITQILEASQQGPLHLDAALATTPFGKSAGTASYWVHPDNLEEAKVLLLRHMQELYTSPMSSRHSSTVSLVSHGSLEQPTSGRDQTHVVYFDNVQRLLKDDSINKSSKVAATGRWYRGSDSVVTISNLTAWGSPSDVIRLKRKDLPNALGTNAESAPKTKRDSANAWDLLRVQAYLSEQKDLVPLAESHSRRSRYAGVSNSRQAGIWATLDTDIVHTSHNAENLGSVEHNPDSGDAFPYAILEIRWEFGRAPEVVKAFNATHLAERVENFSLESAAIYSVNATLERPSWWESLAKDIRKLPVTTRMGNIGKRSKTDSVRMLEPSSGTSSTDEPTDSIFSLPAMHSSAASDSSPNMSMRDPSSPALTKPAFSKSTRAKNKRARFDTKSPLGKSQRYWNEFDDGDSDVNQEEAYTIYVDPDESFPGTETVSNAMKAVHSSFNKAKTRIASWLPFAPPENNSHMQTERTPLLIDTSLSPESSDSDSTPETSAMSLKADKRRSEPFPQDPIHAWRSSSYRPYQPLSRRQIALERTYLQFYTGLLILAYVFLLLSGILLGTGRKKARLEVEAGVMCGILAAEICAIVSIVLINMRRMNLNVVHRGIVYVASVGAFIIGFGLMISVAGRSLAH